MSFLKKLFGRSNGAKSEETLPWVEGSQNPWGTRVLDLRSVTQAMLATSQDPQMATNAISYGAEDGTSFIGIEPVADGEIDANIVLPIDRFLAPGVLFIPQLMEHKWAIYFHNDTLIFIRSWQRQVFVTAKTKQHDGRLVVESIKGKFVDTEEDAVFTRRTLKNLLANYATDELVPVLLPSEFSSTHKKAALWAFGLYGNVAQFGIFDENFDPRLAKPLRSHSLLHIAVARGDLEKISEHVRHGINVNLLAADGLAPLHWSIASPTTDAMKKLLALGADPDVPSVEGATPLMNAIQSNKVEHLNLLLEADADVNARDNRGFTSLHRAAEMGFVEIVRTLLSKGADKKALANGYTPLSFAEKRGHKEIVKLLRS